MWLEDMECENGAVWDSLQFGNDTSLGEEGIHRVTQQ